MATPSILFLTSSSLGDASGVGRVRIGSVGAVLNGQIAIPNTASLRVRVGSFGSSRRGTITSAPTAAVRVSSTGTAIWGGVLTGGIGGVRVSSVGVALWGGLGVGALARVRVGRKTARSVTGYAASGFGRVRIGSSGAAYRDNIVGSGKGRIRISSFSGPLSPAGVVEVEYHWDVFPMNITNFAVFHHGTQFSSMRVVGDKVYATNSQGIQLVGGRDDNGVPISAILTKGPQDFGTSKIKVATDVYLEGIFEGGYTFEIWSDSGSGIVEVDDGVPRLHGSKADLPRGVFGREHGFTFCNKDGSYFEISAMEFLLLISEFRRGRQNCG